MRQRIFHAADTFRDEWPDEELELVAQARRDFEPYIRAAQAAEAEGKTAHELAPLPESHIL